MVTFVQPVDGQPYDADDFIPVLLAVEGHEDRIVALEQTGRIATTTFSTDLVSSGATEVVGYSQSVTLVSGRVYRVWVKALMNGGTAGNVGEVRVRYATGTLSTSSTLADRAQYPHAAAGSPGRGTLTFFAEFTAPSSGAFNIGIGVATVVGSTNETIVSSSTATVISVDDVT